MRDREPFFTDEERKKPYWHQGNDHEIYTSYDPSNLGVHVVPYYFPHEGKHIDVKKLMSDIFTFGLSWHYQCWERMNGFMAPGARKYFLHERGWDPKVHGYDAMIIENTIL